MELFIIALVCLSAFGDARPQNEAVRPRTVLQKGLDERSPIPKAPVLEEPVDNSKLIAKSTNTKLTKQEEEARLFRQQAENANYSFDSYVDDGIMGQTHSRTEERNGLNVKGMYSYSDGFFKRTVHYEADDKGYRVVMEENEPIGDGPIINYDGEARVRSSLGSEYKITIDDYQKRIPVKPIARHDE